jgi:hypothetical protein
MDDLMDKGLRSRRIVFRRGAFVYDGAKAKSRPKHDFSQQIFKITVQFIPEFRI